MATPAPRCITDGRRAEEHVERLLPQLELHELVGQLVQSVTVPGGAAPGVPPVPERLRGLLGSTILASGPTAGNVADAGVRRAELDAVRSEAAASRLGIPLLVARDVVHGHRTVHPVPLAQAASFDEDLVEELAAHAAAEAAADGVDWAYAPAVDLAEDPRWGRVAEGYGESPLVAARLGAAAVRGTQRAGRVAACAKHYVGYGLVRGGRDYAGVDVGEVALRNRHLRPFRAAVDAGVLSVMAGFPAVDGVPLHAHRHLLRGVLKDEWGFDGVVVADWNGVGELVHHGVAADLREAARLAISAGVDVDMASGAYAAHLEQLVLDGEVDVELVRDAARRVLLLKARLGLFADRPPAPAPDDAAGRDLARRAVRGAAVLLRWDGAPVVPARGRVHVTGPLADDRTALMGTWVLDGDPALVETPLSAARELLGDRVVADDARFGDLTVAAAREAAVTLAVVGEHPRRSGEDSAVTDLGLPPGQLDLLRALRRTAERLVVVVVAGRPLHLDPVAALADVLLVSGHPGSAAGELVRVLLQRGEPRGRLPATWPSSPGSVPLTSGEGPTGRPQPDLSRYADERRPPSFPFGGGSGWGSLLVGEPRAASDVLPRDGQVVLVVPVHNPGPRTASELLLIELHDPVAAISRPRRELVDWRWVTLPPGGREDVEVVLGAASAAYSTGPGAPRVDEGELHVFVAGRRVVLQVVGP